VSSRPLHRIFVGQDQHKFSVAHMTVFPDGSKERLHGHNFNVSVALDLRVVSFETLLDLGIVKREVERLCREWNEHLLVGERCPALKILRRDAEEIEFTLCGKRYVAPAEDVLLLPLDNIIVETLSMEFGRQLADRLAPVLRIDVVAGLEVDVREARGQGGTFYLALKKGQE
jgi:6-pyruvoyltetrahydropterin/6-carboxytetrahydropterin synthase